MCMWSGDVYRLIGPEQIKRLEAGIPLWDAVLKKNEALSPKASSGLHPFREVCHLRDLINLYLMGRIWFTNTLLGSVSSSCQPCKLHREVLYNGNNAIWDMFLYLGLDPKWFWGITSGTSYCLLNPHAILQMAFQIQSLNSNLQYGIGIYHSKEWKFYQACPSC